MKLPKPKQLKSGNWRIQLQIDGERYFRTNGHKTRKEYYDPVLMSDGPTAEVLKHDILELMHTKTHTENEERSKYWPIKGFI